MNHRPFDDEDDVSITHSTSGRLIQTIKPTTVSMHNRKFDNPLFKKKQQEFKKGRLSEMKFLAMMRELIASKPLLRGGKVYKSSRLMDRDHDVDVWLTIPHPAYGDKVRIPYQIKSSWDGKRIFLQERRENNALRVVPQVIVVDETLDLPCLWNLIAPGIRDEFARFRPYQPA